MEDRTIQAAMDRHWAASAVGDLETEHEIYHEDVVVESPSRASGSAAGLPYRLCVDTTRLNWALPFAA